MEERRKQYDRRQTDRRQPQSRQLHPIVFVLVGATIAVTGGWFYVEFYSKESHVSANSKSETTTKQSKHDAVAKFRAEVLARDQGLREKLKLKRESRRTNQGGLQARQEYSNRLAELEAEYESHKKFANTKGSIGWEMKQRIKKMKMDAPPD